VLCAFDLLAMGAEVGSVPLRARVGTATGSDVEGDPIGSHVAQEKAVVGETAILAARLQGC
jgi:class 3 adenylate cyclase